MRGLSLNRGGNRDTGQRPLPIPRSPSMPPQPAPVTSRPSDAARARATQIARGLKTLVRAGVPARVSAQDFFKAADENGDAKVRFEKQTNRRQGEQ